MKKCKIIIMAALAVFAVAALAGDAVMLIMRKQGVILIRIMELLSR